MTAIGLSEWNRLYDLREKEEMEAQGMMVWWTGGSDVRLEREAHLPTLLLVLWQDRTEGQVQCLLWCGVILCHCTLSEARLVQQCTARVYQRGRCIDIEGGLGYSWNG